MHRNIKVFLASSSPRRREMMSYVFENVEFLSLKTEEPRWQIKESASHYLHRCVDVKFAEALSMVSNLSQKHHLVLVADTIVTLGQEVLGKPSSKKEATVMLEKLSGKWHVVSTAYCWRWQGLEHECVDVYHEEKSRVRFRALNKSTIEAYVKTGEPMDKAGAYGIQGLGLALVDRIEGCYQNIAGFPLNSFLVSLKKNEIPVSLS